MNNGNDEKKKHLTNFERFLLPCLKLVRVNQVNKSQFQRESIFDSAVSIFITMHSLSEDSPERTNEMTACKKTSTLSVVTRESLLKW